MRHTIAYVSKGLDIETAKITTFLSIFLLLWSIGFTLLH